MSGPIPPSVALNRCDMDHGRGAGLDTWQSHGPKLPESKYI